MNTTRLEFLFKCYVNGSSTPEEARELMEYIRQNDDPRLKTLLNELWEHSFDNLPKEKAENILNSILTTKNKVIPFQKKSYGWARVAAAVAITALAGAAYYQFNSTSSFKETATELAEVPQLHQYIKLPDGSTAILNNGSNLEYATTFQDKSVREVYLTGEAFFDIHHDDAKPFIVHTGDISTTVLGTAFNIKAYPDQNDITVTVSRGKVKVSDDEKLLGILKPDEQITFHKDNRFSKLETVKSEAITAWTEKDIFFDNVSMLDAARQLEDRFHVQITFKNDQIKNCRFTATFVRGEDLDQILDVICEFNQVKYSADVSGNIEVSGSGCTL
jgi:transmembrane sensor